jgi:hypothetical protein
MAHLLVSPLGGGVQPRLEINNFVKDVHQFSLYVQALGELIFFSLCFDWLTREMCRPDVRHPSG